MDAVNPNSTGRKPGAPDTFVQPPYFATGPPIAVRIPDAARCSGLGKSTLYALIARGQLESVMVGRRRLVLYSSLQKLLLKSGGSV
jgi:excisionase family DNA binding protein